MGQLGVFNQISLDGYFRATDGDVSWGHNTEDDPEYMHFVEENAASRSVLLLGRKTYELFASFWPTPAAMQQMPVIARGINAAKKLVVSRTLKEPSWANTTVLASGDPVGDVRRLKSETEGDITILGSGTLVAPLLDAGLVDELKLVVIPIVLGQGKTMFEGIATRSFLRLATTRSFRNGRVYLVYRKPRAGEAASAS